MIILVIHMILDDILLIQILKMVEYKVFLLSKINMLLET